MKVITCPKGGRVPEGYCKTSCLNYKGPDKKQKPLPFQRLRRLFAGDGRTWLQIYKEDVAPRSRKANCRTP